jgi:ERCC4-related helicase
MVILSTLNTLGEIMKITDKDYDIINEAFNNLDKEINLKNIKKIYKEKELSGMRYRWDMLEIAISLGYLTHKSLKNLYKYLEDCHIDTALKQITKTQYWMTNSEIHEITKSL